MLLFISSLLINLMYLTQMFLCHLCQIVELVLKHVCKYERTSKYKRHGGFSCITETLDRSNEKQKIVHRFNQGTKTVNITS